MKSTKYKIGDLSKITGLSLQTIRRYEEAGIIKVERDDENGYRYYRAYDVAVLIRIKMYRSFGFSINEIVEIFNHGFDVAPTMLKQNQTALLKQIQRLTKLVECNLCLLADLNAMQEDIDAIQLTIRPAWFGLLYRHQENIIEDKQLNQVVSKWIDCVPLVQQLFYMEKDSFINNTDQYSVGIVTKQEYAHICDLAMHDSVLSFPEQQVITLVVSAIGEFHIDSNTRQRLFDYLDQHHLVIDGPLLGSTVISEFKENQIVHYQKLYIPVK